MKNAVFYRTKKIIGTVFVILVIFSILCIEIPPIHAAESTVVPGNTTDLSYIIYECDTKQTLLRQNTDLPADASLLSRLMTCIIVLENASVTDYVTITGTTVSSSGRYTLIASKQYTVNLLLKSVILCNADNAARALAIHINPNKEYFVSLMNQKAAEIGMSNTYFTNVDGSSDQLQRTTVYDMCLFWSYAMANPQFRNIASNSAAHIWEGTAVLNECKMVTNSAFSEATLSAGAYTVYDTAASLSTTMFYLIGSNSGSSTPSVKLALVMSGATDQDAYSLGNNFVKDALLNFKKTALVSKNETITTADIGGNDLFLNAGETCYCMMPSDFTLNYIENISYSVLKNTVSSNTSVKAGTLEDLTLPIEEGTIIGTANYLLKDGSTHTVNLIAGNSLHSDIKTINVFYKAIKENTDIFILISVLLSCELVLAIMILFNKLRNKRKFKL